MGWEGGTSFSSPQPWLHCSADQGLHTAVIQCTLCLRSTEMPQPNHWGYFPCMFLWAHLPEMRKMNLKAERPNCHLKRQRSIILAQMLGVCRDGAPPPLWAISASPARGFQLRWEKVVESPSLGLFRMMELWPLGTWLSVGSGGSGGGTG